MPRPDPGNPMLHGESKNTVVKDLGQADVKGKLVAIAYAPIGNSPEEGTAFFKSEMAKCGKVIQDAGLKAE